MATIRSVNTTCIYNHSVNDDICQGLKIDVEFLDGVPDNRFSRAYNKACALLLALFSAQRVPERATKIKTYGAKLLLWLIRSPKLRWRLVSYCENRIKQCHFNDYTYVRYLACALRLREDFNDIVYMDFEGYRMPVPIGYDEMLRAAYDDYMQLPPEDKRRPATDNLVFYDLDHSYKDYRGKYYCVYPE